MDIDKLVPIVAMAFTAMVAIGAMAGVAYALISAFPVGA